MKNGFLLTIAISVLFMGIITSCQATPPGDLSESDIHGMWRQVVSGEAWGPFLELKEDRTFMIAYTFDDPIDFGMYQLEGNTITFESDEESSNCPGFRRWTAAEMIENDKFQLRIMDSECPDVYVTDSIIVLERYNAE